MRKQPKKQVISNEMQLAEHWGVTARRVRQMAQEGVAVRAGAGFNLLQSDAAFIGWLRRDEEGSRARRRMMELKSEALATRLQRQDRELLTPAELWDFALQLLQSVRTAYTASTTRLYQEVSASHPQLARAIQRDAQAFLNHLLATLIEPEFQRWKKHVADEQRLRFLAATRALRTAYVEHLASSEGMAADEVPYAHRGKSDSATEPTGEDAGEE